MPERVAVAAPPIPSVVELWDRHRGADVFVCGFGSSLLDFDWHRLDDRVAIVCNDAITKWPTATYHLWADGRLYRFYWHVPYGADTLIVTQPKGTHRMQTAYGWPHRGKLRLFERVQGPEPGPIARASPVLWNNTTVAVTAIMFAWKLGAGRVYLLGVDGYLAHEQAYYADGAALPAGFGAVEWLPDGRGVQARHREWAADMRTLRAFLSTQPDAPSVVNLNPRTTIDAWPTQPREEVL